MGILRATGLAFLWSLWAPSGVHGEPAAAPARPEAHSVGRRRDVGLSPGEGPGVSAGAPLLGHGGAVRLPRPP